MLGDNSIFVKKKLFDKLKGYKNQQIMEDFDLSKRLKRYKIHIIKDPVLTSARRFGNKVVKVLLLMQLIRIMYSLKFKDSTIKRLYK